MAGRDLSRFFEPRGVAVIGSFREGFFGGYVIVKSLLNAGYRGGIYPVNPAYREVHGLKVHSSIVDIEGEVDLALIMINARAVKGVMEECREKGIGSAVVISDGFAERDREGLRLQQELVETAKGLGIRIIGPNTAGVLNTANGFNPCPYEAGYYRVQQGSVAVCAQTGMINPQAFPYPGLPYGISKICDLGNKSDVCESDILDYLGGDPDTRVISFYLESISDGRRFLEIAERVAAEKPTLVIKSGRTKEGARASSSHTGSMAMDDKIFDAVCRQAGLLRLDEFGDLFDIPKIFASQPLPQGHRLGIVTVTGGVGVITIDRAARYGLRIHPLSAGTREKLDGIFPGTGNMPVDIGPMMAAVKDAFSLYPRMLQAVMADENVDLLFNVLWANAQEAVLERYMEAYHGLKGRYAKPIATWVYGPSEEGRRELAGRLERMGFPVFRSPEAAVKALGLAWEYARRLRERRSCRASGFRSHGPCPP
jgi:acyl-CoA synthetase (NDP forming)